MNPYYIGVALVILSATGFGMIPIFAIYAYQGGTTVTTLLFLRFFIAALFFYSFIMINRMEININKSLLVSLFLLGSIFYMMQSNFYFSSVKYIPASLAVLLFCTYPIFVAVLSALFNGEVLTKRVFISIAVSITGLVLVLGATFNRIDMHGVMLACAAALVYSCYIVLGSRVLKKLPVMVTSAFVTMFASFSFLAIGLTTGTLHFNLETQAWFAIAGLGLFSTIIAVFTFFRGIALIGSTRASILSMVEPLTTIGFSAMLFQERLTWVQLIGAVAVLAGTMLVVTAGRAPVEVKAEAEVEVEG